MKPKHVVVISLDAVGETDIDFLRTLPTFKEFYKNAAFCDKVLGIYPTITYPSHSSIITGLYPRKHGIINNTQFQPKRKSPDWMWYRSLIKGNTLYDEVKKRGGKVGAFLWPVTAKSKNIDYHVPEIFPNRRWDRQIFTSLRNGSKIFQLKKFLKYKHLIKGIQQPYLDNFTMACAMDTILEYKPNLTLIHLTDVDSQKHFGSSSEVVRALKLLDERLRVVIDTLKKADIYDKSTIVILGDHSQMECHSIVYLNTFFKEKGWLEYDEKRKIVKNYKVIARDCDGSCYVYIHPKYQESLYSTVYEFLKNIKDSNKYGIETIYSASEAYEKGASGYCSFMVEAKDGYYFQNEADKRLYKIDRENDGRRGIMTATHGYDPRKPKYHTIFAMNGVGVRPSQIEEMCLIDEAPTMAKLMGFEMKNVDGKIIDKFLESGNKKNA